MSEEFKGNVPIISITQDGAFFVYFCEEIDKHNIILLRSSCMSRSPRGDKCFDCLLFNPKFTQYYRDNDRCSCGRRVDFGYFMLIYLLEKAELLPDDFKMECCICKKEI